jgi:hypothetical protein
MLKADACDVVYCIHWLEDNRKIILQAKKQTKKKVYNLPHQGGDKRPTFTTTWAERDRSYWLVVRS